MSSFPVTAWLGTRVDLALKGERRVSLDTVPLRWMIDAGRCVSSEDRTTSLQEEILMMPRQIGLFRVSAFEQRTAPEEEANLSSAG